MRAWRISGTALPCFKPAEWDGAERCVCRRFSVEDIESGHFPWLAFGFDQAHTFELASQDDLSALGKTADEVERQATENVRLRKATCRIVPLAKSV